VGDKILLSQFLDCLEGVTRRQVEARRAEDPDLSYQQIFDDVDMQFSRTVKQTGRAKLQKLTLENAGKSWISMKDFHTFDAEFRILRADCKGMSDDEARNLYQCALPGFLAEAVQKQLLRKERKPCAIFHGMAGYTPKQLRGWLEESLATDFPKVVMENENMVVYCHDETQFRQLLSLNNRRLSNGQTISIIGVDAQLTLDEIRQICKDILQPRENVYEMKNAKGGVNKWQPRSSRVATVEDEGSNADDEEHQVAMVATQGAAKSQPAPPSSTAATKGTSSQAQRSLKAGGRGKKRLGKGSTAGPPTSSSSSSNSHSVSNANVQSPPQTMMHELQISVRNEPPAQQSGKGSFKGGKSGNSWAPRNDWSNAWQGNGSNWQNTTSGKGGRGKGNNNGGGCFICTAPDHWMNECPLGDGGKGGKGGKGSGKGSSNQTSNQGGGQSGGRTAPPLTL
jgi:hypothetical protein